MLRLGLVTLTAASVTGNTILMDASGSLNRQIPDVSITNGVVAVISSPGTSSSLGITSSDILSLDDSEGGVRLICRGATLNHGVSSAERTSLATTSLTAGSVVIDGVTEGDIEMGLRSSRHARTLTALIRARLAASTSQQLTVLLGVMGPVDEDVQEKLEAEVRAIFQAAAVEVSEGASFDDLYNIVAVSVDNPSDARQALATATEAAKSAGVQDASLSEQLSRAMSTVRETSVAGRPLDPPHIAQAFLACRQSYAKQARAVRAKVAAWRSRVARGLTVDGFGNEAEALMERTLVQGYDTETLASAGLPLVAPYRLELRIQLQTLVESAIQEMFAASVANLEKSTIKKFEAQLLRKQGSASSEESAFDDNKAAMRNAAYQFDSTMGDMEVPSLGLTKEKASQEMSIKLNDALIAFPDSPAAKLKRTREVTKVTSKEKKPSQRSVDLGLDLVAMIRPDGFGSLQGFAGYQLGGNSVTVGVHNDADDPQVISQFGGVRPPLLRVQPKLRVDVEL